MSVVVSSMGVREHIPLEQGLRLGRSVLVKFDCPVREHIPLEQGLRLVLFAFPMPSPNLSESIFH